MTSDAFQEFGKVEVAKEQLMRSVKGPRITGRQSLMMRMLTLSGSGDLLEGIDDTIRSTCVLVTGVKLNSSSDEFLVIGVEIKLVTQGSTCKVFFVTFTSNRWGINGWEHSVNKLHFCYLVKRKNGCCK